MSRLFIRISSAFTGGAIGGLVSSYVLYFAGANGITHAMNVQLAPSLTTAWLFPRIIWGGFWGLVFLLANPLAGNWLTRAFLVSLAPTLFQLFYAFPYLEGKGVAGNLLGALTPLVVLICNLLWSLTTAFWIRRVGA